MTYKPTQEDIKYILDNYMTSTSTEIANHIGCSSSYVKKIGKAVSKGKKKYRRYYFNEHYFDNIDTYEKAYWFGFIMADGCLYKREGHQYSIKISLNINDIEHLNKFKKAINGNNKILKTIRKTDGREYCSIELVSDIMGGALIKYGCSQRKTNNITFYNFNNDELIFGYLNGYIDGDGSIQKCKDRNVYRYRLSIVGTKDFIYGVYEFFNKFNIKGKVREDKRDYSFPFYEIYFERMEYLNFIFSNTYNKNIIYLNRKKELVDDYYLNKYDKNKEYYNITSSKSGK